MTEILFHNSYTGSRFTYGCRNRPPMYACIPNGHIVGSEQPHNLFSFGTIDYPRELTEQETKSYELTLLAPIDTERALRRAAAMMFCDGGMLDIWQYIGMTEGEMIYIQQHLEQARELAKELFGWETKKAAPCTS